MKVINFIGGPNTGKSTTASGLFYYMKVHGINVELVNEYAKEKTWEEHSNILQDQLYILAKQNRKLERLRGKVDYAITDSPIFLGLNYMPDGYPTTFEPFVMDIWNSYDNITYYLHNDGDLTYQQSGRSQSLDQAKEKDNEIRNFVETRNISYKPIKISANSIILETNHIGTIFNDIFSQRN